MILPKLQNPKTPLYVFGKIKRHLQIVCIFHNINIIILEAFRGVGINQVCKLVQSIYRGK